jgi:GNAT superfamily N-acetyltransferase
MTLTVQSATPPDADTLAGIEAEVWRDAYPALVPRGYLIVRLAPQRRRAIWRRRLATPAKRIRIVVAREDTDGDIIAYATFGPSRWPALAFEGEIHELYVRPGHQGRGHGRALVGWIAERLLEARVSSLCVEVLTGNNSRFFYEALGGRLAAHGEHALAGVTLPTLVYGWQDVGMLAKANAV